MRIDRLRFFYAKLRLAINFSSSVPTNFANWAALLAVQALSLMKRLDKIKSKIYQKLFDTFIVYLGIFW
jgi:hypothetical protein